MNKGKNLLHKPTSTEKNLILLAGETGSSTCFAWVYFLLYTGIKSCIDQTSNKMNGERHLGN